MIKKMVTSEKGMTLIEIMVVVVILGILVGVVIPSIMGRPEEARRTKAMAQIRNIEAGLKLYKLDNGVYASTEQGLEALVQKPDIGVIPKNWNKDGYISRIPPDPWGNPYIYLSPGAHGDYDLLSYGADGIEGGVENDADIASWNIE